VSHSFRLVPEAFTMVKFDAAEFLALAEAAATDVGVPEDVPVAIEIDEALPLPLIASAAEVQDGGIALWFTGGTFEDPRRQACLEPVITRTELAAALLRGLDRRSGGFEDAPPDADLTDRQRAIWDVYTEGRLARLDGYTIREPRRRYTFRLRGGFNDVADAEYERLWSIPSLTWTELAAIDEKLIEADTRPEAKRTSLRKETLRTS